MIQAAIHSTIDSIINAFPLVGDIEADFPFAVYSTDQTPLYTKAGITGYENLVIITVVDDDNKRGAEKAELVKAAVLAMSGTIQGTTVDFSRFVQTDTRYDEVNGLYGIITQIRVFTQNV